MTWLPSIPYPPPQEGYWGEVTSTLNWCEEDYYMTPYSAEIVNSITNATLFYLAYRGMSNCIRNEHPTVFRVGFGTYLVIGLGSFLFHATLKFSMQILDEIAMIYTTCVLFYAAFSHGRPVQIQTMIMLGTVFIAVSITGYYLYFQDPVFHQVMFAALTFLVLFRSIYLMEVTLRPSVRNKKGTLVRSVHTDGYGPSKTTDSAERERIDKRDQKILDDMYKILPMGVCCALGGFAIWNLDNEFCPTIRRWRYAIGMPWGFLLEGHGWWHILMGFAGYYQLVWSVWLRYCLDGNQDQVVMVWPSLWTSIPVLMKRDLLDGKKEGISNGRASQAKGSKKKN